MNMRDAIIEQAWHARANGCAPDEVEVDDLLLIIADIAVELKLNIAAVDDVIMSMGSAASLNAMCGKK